ncbi:hypothetical protein [Cellulomonas xylanilytica]|uniref:Uncharacterized protein n=1 Tax=Cellulomonas xylanilytica TaxID=233583 RepID=A0A510V4G5_9CELL|nr:hypothetical protein [Cellulomonas xylanilytica]GEK21769.1 hypothetical protein CXY01_22890 [Cellulomonas xylanilytica]
MGGEDEAGSRELAMFGGVAVQSGRPSDQDVVAVLRDGVEHVVASCLGVDLTWTTTAVVASDDLSTGNADIGRPGLDWAFALGRGEPLLAVTLSATATALEGYDWHPRWLPVTVRATMPVDVPHGRGDGGGLVVGLSMHRWALYGGGDDLVRVADVLTPWLLDSADRLDADAGYATLDRVTAEDAESPWERVTGCLPALRDVTRTLWGYGWGTLLSPVHVDAVGGRVVLDSLREVLPAVVVRDVGGGRTWLTLGPDPAAVTPQDVATLRSVLAPALPRGSRSVDRPSGEHLIV